MLEIVKSLVQNEKILLKGYIMQIYLEKDNKFNLFILSASFLLITVVDISLIILKPNVMLHWFLIPITISGLLLLPDCIKYFCGKYDVFDPKAIISLAGMHFFYIAPIIFLFNEMQMLYVVNPPDWRNWVGIFGVLNSVGILIFKFINNNKYLVPLKNKQFHVKWELEKGRFLILSSIFLVIGLIAELYIFRKIGGIKGFMVEKVERTGKLDGAGWILMFGESLPILFMFLITYLFVNKNKEYKRNKIVILIVTIIFFFLQFFIAGFRGSRSVTIFALFWALGIIHFYWRPIRVKAILIASIPILFFMIGYGYYKNVGYEIVDYFKGDITFEEIQRKSQNRGTLNTLVSDLARVDTQSYTIYRLLEYPNEYSLAFGRTYIGDLSILIPKTIWPSRPPTKIKEGTELFYGKGGYIPNIQETSRVFGLVGEGLLNFHFIGVPFLFVLWSILVFKLRKIMLLLPRRDARWLFIPLLVQLSVTSLNADLDNIVFNLVKNGLVPFLVIYFGSKKSKVNIDNVEN